MFLFVTNSSTCTESEGDTRFPKTEGGLKAARPGTAEKRVLHRLAW